VQESIRKKDIGASPDMDPLTKDILGQDTEKNANVKTVDINLQNITEGLLFYLRDIYDKDMSKLS
jgi:hypothetical protein